MTTRYLILRANVDLERGGEGGAVRAWRRGGRGDAELTVHTVDGHETDAGRLREDPRNAAVVDADHLLTLVAPLGKKAAQAADFAPAGAIKMPSGLLAVGADTSPATGQGVTVAILDTGIDAQHPAFAGKSIVKRNFTEEGDETDVTDTEGHGTHCAGTICGGEVDGVRVGVAHGLSKLCVGKVLGQNGSGSLDQIVKGLLWAVNDENAQVVSMSLGYDLPGNVARLIEEKGMNAAAAANVVLRSQSEISRIFSTLRSFLETRSPNVVFVAASGNESERPGLVLDAGLPAAEMLSVGAVGPVGDKWAVAPFSNGRASLVAPGVNVVSAAAGGGWASMSGTSMATPHVAGVAALWAEKLRSDGQHFVPGALLASLRGSAVRAPLADADVGATGGGMVRAPQ